MLSGPPSGSRFILTTEGLEGSCDDTFVLRVRRNSLGDVRRVLSFTSGEQDGKRLFVSNWEVALYALG